MVRNSDHDYGIKQATENDPHIIRVGLVLRSMGLDELPQLLNIFRGEMSFVGPRSLAVGEIVRDEKGGVVKELGVRLFKLTFFCSCVEFGQVFQRAEGGAFIQ